MAPLKYAALFSVILASTAAVANPGALGELNARACGSEEHARTGQSAAGGQNRYRRGVMAAQAGAEADPMFPFGVKLEMHSPLPGGMAVSTDHCGGTILNAEWILTAAHCVAKRNFDHIAITLGSRNMRGERIVRRVAYDAVCHSGANDLLEHDVALIRVAEPLPRELVTVALAQQNAAGPRIGDIVYGAGWKIAQNGAEDMMQRVPLRVKNVDPAGFITVVAADGGSQGLCRGESGGPLIMRDNFGARQIGVFSGVEPTTVPGYGGEPQYCMTPGYEMYFTPVSRYRRWAENVVSFCDHNPWACRNTARANPAAANRRHYAPVQQPRGMARQPMAPARGMAPARRMAPAQRRIAPR